MTPAREYRRCTPDQVAAYVLRGWRVVGASLYGLGDVSVLIMREIPASAPAPGL